MSQSLTCPYCNATVPAATPIELGQRLPCPRCEETFTVQEVPKVTDSAELPHASPQPQHRFSNRQVALIVVGVMTLMASVGLTYALVTQQFRRDNDRGIGRDRPGDIPGNPKARTPVEPRAPLELDGLRYLPSGMNVVAGIHLAQLRQQKATQSWLRATIRIAGVPLSLDGLKDLVGIELWRIDHVIVGVRIHKDDLLPSVILIVRTRSPFNQSAVIAALSAQIIREPGTPKVHRIKKQWGKSEVFGLMSMPDERTLVLGWNVRNDRQMLRVRQDLDDVNLSNDLKEMLSKHVQPPPMLLWVVGRSNNWTEALGLINAFVKLDRKDDAILKSAPEFAFWTRVDPRGVVIEAAVDCRDVAGRRLLEKRIRKWFEGRPLRLLSSKNLGIVLGLAETALQSFDALPSETLLRMQLR